MSQSLSGRIFWSIGLTFVRAGVSFATGLILARLLGADDFGRFAFLISTFVAIRQLCDLSASNAFFTFLSERPRSRKFVQYYWIFVMAQVAVCLMLLLVLLPVQVLETIWHGEPKSLLALACLAAFSQYSIWAGVSQMGDASRETKKVQIVNTVIIVCHLLGVVALFLFGALALPALMGLIILEWCLGALTIRQLYRYAADSQFVEPPTSFGDAWIMYWQYCRPLFLLTLSVFAFTFADRWMLQAWAGARDQAYLTIGLQLASIALLAVTSILRILWKEISEAHANDDQVLVRELYHRTVRIIFIISVLGSATVMPWVQHIITYILGPDYQAGLTAVTILLLVPIAQSLGQVTGTLLLATHKTQMTARVGISFAIISLGFSYIMLAPTNSAFIPGFDLGVNGLAIKLASLGFCSVWTLMYLIRHEYGMPISPIIQVVVIAVTTALSFLLHASLSPLSVIMQTISHGFLVVSIVCAMVVLAPQLFGLSKSMVVAGIARISLRIAQRMQKYYD